MRYRAWATAAGLAGLATMAVVVVPAWACVPGQPDPAPASANPPAPAPAVPDGSPAPGSTGVPVPPRPARDETAGRVAAGLAAMALASFAVSSADFHRRARRAPAAPPVPVWHRLQPSAVVLLAGAAAYGAIRPRLDATVVFIGVVALFAGLASGRRLHFVPIGLVLGAWGLGIWLVDGGRLAGERSSAVTVAGLGLGLVLCAKLARTADQRRDWLTTGAYCALNAGVAYYVLYDLPAGFARWPAWVTFLAGWAVWEQVRAGQPIVAGPGTTPARGEPGRAAEAGAPGPRDGDVAPVGP